MKNVLNRSDRRIAILDVEASALGPGSYPIEVGVALVHGPSEPIGVGAKLIRPTIDWLETGVWSKLSETVHGIPLERVQREGEPVDEVCDWLNVLLGTNAIVATDAPRYDQDWLDTLFAAAGREQKFRIFDFKLLTRDFSTDQHRHLAYLLGRDSPPHRAAADAGRLASRLMETHCGHPPREGPLPRCFGSSQATDRNLGARVGASRNAMPCEARSMPSRPVWPYSSTSGGNLGAKIWPTWGYRMLTGEAVRAATTRGRADKLTSSAYRYCDYRRKWTPMSELSEKLLHIRNGMKVAATLFSLFLVVALISDLLGSQVLTDELSRLDQVMVVGVIAFCWILYWLSGPWFRFLKSLL